MSSLGGIIGSDKWTLSDNMSVAVTFLIEKDEDISRIADHFCNGDRVQAFSDLMEKGLKEMLDMCDMDDHLVETERVMQNTSFYNQARGMQLPTPPKEGL